MAQIIHRNRRRDHRRTLPALEIRLAGLDGYVSRDWSMGGFAARGPDAGLACGDPVNGGLRLVRGDGDWLEFSGAVTRIQTDDGFVAIHFTSLSPPCFALLESLWRRPTRVLVPAPCGPRLMRD